MPEFFEILIIVAFGFSWPMNIVRSVKAKTAKGKSIWFCYLILFGYIAGIISKFTNPAYMEAFNRKWYVLCFYFLNFIMVLIDTILYYRNRRLDKLQENPAPTEEK